ncbi:unnamed protein product [Moneuplotes crassus]|uniref:Uncharacterized protein n=1 Tax=Euplotes crassus TaxID=5936 RepID=A0AAD1UFQ2_EUPCR|nr:unnamed protein product [Moneuplotes crassus]
MKKYNRNKCKTKQKRKKPVIIDHSGGKDSLKDEEIVGMNELVDGLGSKIFEDERVVKMLDRMSEDSSTKSSQNPDGLTENYPMFTSKENDQSNPKNETEPIEVVNRIKELLLKEEDVVQFIKSKSSSVELDSIVLSKIAEKVLKTCEKGRNKKEFQKLSSFEKYRKLMNILKSQS